MDLKSFCNAKLLESEGEFTTDEISVLMRISSWGIDSSSSLENPDRDIIGLKAKRLFDYARIRYIQEKLPHLKCGGIRYCDPEEESPECILIVAYPPESALPYREKFSKRLIRRLSKKEKIEGDLYLTQDD